jgi:L-aminopeptidase/D-esterase-like protein
LHLVEQVHAVLLTGGSAFGLEAAGGVMRYLEERGAGFDTGVARVPIVPAAVIFDLALGRADVRPDAEMGYQACLNASPAAPAEGCVGAGMGASAGKILGMGRAVKSGLGAISLHLESGLVVGALAVVNPLGDVIDPANGQILVGARLPDGPAEGGFADSWQVMLERAARGNMQFHTQNSNTTIGVVATNASLSKDQANFLAQMAQDGLARTIRPAHTLLDGDTIFALATGELPCDLSILGAITADLFARAIVRAVQTATPAGGLPAANKLKSHL